MKRVLVVFLSLAFSACATPRTRAQAMRHASTYQAWGAPLTLSGIAGGAASIVGGVATKNKVYAIPGAVSGLFLIVGTVLLVRSNDAWELALDWDRPKNTNPLEPKEPPPPSEPDKQESDYCRIAARLCAQQAVPKAECPLYQLRCGSTSTSTTP